MIKSQHSSDIHTRWFQQCHMHQKSIGSTSTLSVLSSHYKHVPGATTIHTASAVVSQKQVGMRHAEVARNLFNGTYV